MLLLLLLLPPRLVGVMPTMLMAMMTVMRPANLLGRAAAIPSAGLRDSQDRGRTSCVWKQKLKKWFKTKANLLSQLYLCC